VIDYHRLFTSRIEVIDLAVGAVIARHELPARLISVLPQGRVAWWSEGLTRGQVTVASVTLHGR
jgi:hypothetical protein